MNLIVEFCIVFLICMAGEWIAALLPFTLPASVISLILLLILLLSGGVKERTIQGTSHFLMTIWGCFSFPPWWELWNTGRAEAAACPLSGGLPCQHTAGVRGNSLERPAADEAVSCKGGVP